MIFQPSGSSVMLWRPTPLARYVRPPLVKTEPVDGRQHGHPERIGLESVGAKTTGHGGQYFGNQMVRPSLNQQGRRHICCPHTSFQQLKSSEQKRLNFTSGWNTIRTPRTKKLHQMFKDTSKQNSCYGNSLQGLRINLHPSTLITVTSYAKTCCAWNYIASINQHHQSNTHIWPFNIYPRWWRCRSEEVKNSPRHILKRFHFQLCRLWEIKRFPVYNCMQIVGCTYADYHTI